MRLPTRFALTLLSLITALGFAADDDAAAAIAKQKATAEANWRTLQMAPTGKVETTHFLVYGLSPEPRLKVLASNLERQYSTAARGLQLEKDFQAWPGKLAVYVFADRGQFRSFVRQIEKRSPEDADHSSASVQGETPHIAVAPGQGRDTADTQAGYDVASGLLTIRAKGTQLPEWLTQGFARATAAQAANTPAGVRKSRCPAARWAGQTD